MANHYSKERMQAEAAFAQTQNRSNHRIEAEPRVSPADEKTARLKAARLERDALKARSKTS